ncbi:helix-turn-helix domain-containing protein [Pedobacter sp. V48]
MLPRDLLTEVSFDLGYSDQSHFIRSFKEFTNLTPKEYITKWLKPHKM